MKEISIRDFAIIDKLNLSLGSGLNVLTGETGAGKSIIIDAVEAVLGGKISSESIRSGATKTVVEALFLVDDSPGIPDVFRSLGLEDVEGEVVLAREILNSGRSIARVNGRPVPVSTLRDVGKHLVDIHGQHEHQSLLYPSVQLELLDRFAGLDGLRKEFASFYASLRKVDQEIESYQLLERQREERRQLLEFQISEIDNARLKIGEDERLSERRTFLLNAERLFKACKNAWSNLEGQDLQRLGALEALRTAISELSGVAKLDHELERAKTSLEEHFYSIQEIASFLRSYQESIDFSSSSLDDVEARLHQISLLKKKYGQSIEEILAFRELATSELRRLQDDDRRRESLSGKRKELFDTCCEKADELSRHRRASARELSRLVVGNLADLGMEKARFEVILQDSDMSPTGTDKVEFVISTNPGEPLRPLSRVASGGEMARIMLAIKAVLSEVDSVPTLIFDEVDAGIGGLTAHAVGERLSRVARHRQVMCITHLPQIACRADNHFTVSKLMAKERVRVIVEELNEDGRCAELARMLGGDPSDEAVFAHARSLLRPRSNT